MARGKFLCLAAGCCGERRVGPAAEGTVGEPARQSQAFVGECGGRLNESAKSPNT